jgi:integrase
VAHVSKRETSRGVRYDVRYRGTDGSEHSKTFRTRHDAYRFAATVETDKLRGTWVDANGARITLVAYATGWLETRASLRPRTRETYDAQLRLHVLPGLGRLKLSALTPHVIREWHHDLVASGGVNANTATKCYRLLRTILNTAVADVLLARNPCRIVRAGIERVAERPTATVAQVWQVAEAMPPHLRAMVLLAGFCGLRLGELLGLEHRYVNVLHGLLTVEQQEHQLRNGELVLGPPKSEAGRRTIALPPFLVPEIESHLASFAAPGPDGRVFRGEKGGPLRRHVVQKHWARARSTVDLPAGFRFHYLRHAANTLTAATGASTRDLMHRMGHASAQAPLRYQHATRRRDTEIAKSLGELIEAASGFSPRRFSPRRFSPRDGRGMQLVDNPADADQRTAEAR